MNFRIYIASAAQTIIILLRMHKFLVVYTSTLDITSVTLIGDIDSILYQSFYDALIKGGAFAHTAINTLFYNLS